MPSVTCRCCNDANAFFGANCLNTRFIYNTAISPSYGFTDDSLNAGEQMHCTPFYCSSFLYEDYMPAAQCSLARQPFLLSSGARTALMSAFLFL